MILISAACFVSPITLTSYVTSPTTTITSAFDLWKDQLLLFGCILSSVDYQPSERTLSSTLTDFDAVADALIKYECYNDITLGLSCSFGFETDETIVEPYLDNFGTVTYPITLYLSDGQSLESSVNLELRNCKSRVVADFEL